MRLERRLVVVVAVVVTVAVYNRKLRGGYRKAAGSIQSHSFLLRKRSLESIVPVQHVLYSTYHDIVRFHRVRCPEEEVTFLGLRDRKRRGIPATLSATQYSSTVQYITVLQL